MKIWNVLKTIQIIILSRLKKPQESKEVDRKRSICKTCEFNSLNAENIPLKKLVIKKLSDFYSWITFKKAVDNLGNCLACQSCSIFYKTAYENICPKNKW